MINEALTAAQRAELLEKIPVGKFCAPEEIAHTVDYLVSPLAGFITVRYVVSISVAPLACSVSPCILLFESTIVASVYSESVKIDPFS